MSSPFNVRVRTSTGVHTLQFPAGKDTLMQELLQQVNQNRRVMVLLCCLVLLQLFSCLFVTKRSFFSFSLQIARLTKLPQRRIVVKQTGVPPTIVVAPEHEAWKYAGYFRKQFF